MFIILLAPRIGLAETASEAVLSILREMRSFSTAAPVSEEQTGRFMRSHFDYAEFAKRSMRSRWERLSEEERQGFIREVKGLLDHLVYERLKGRGETALPRYDLQLKVATPAFAVAKIIFHHKKENFEVELFLCKRNGQWLAFDLTVEGANLLRNYRAQFTRMFDENGYAVLIRKIKEKYS